MSTQQILRVGAAASIGCIGGHVVEVPIGRTGGAAALSELHGSGGRAVTSASIGRVVEVSMGRAQGVSSLGHHQ